MVNSQRACSREMILSLKYCNHEFEITTFKLVRSNYILIAVLKLIVEFTTHIFREQYLESCHNNNKKQIGNCHLID